MNIKPLNDRIVLEIREAAEKTKGGIYLPDNSREEKTEGIVTAIGQGKTLENGSIKPMQVKVGDIVIFGKFAGDDIVIEDKKYKVLTETEVTAVCDL